MCISNMHKNEFVSISNMQRILMLELYFFTVLSFAFIAMMSSIATGAHPTILPKVVALCFFNYDWLSSVRRAFEKWATH